MRSIGSKFEHPMIPADFGYSMRGALAALSFALATAALLYAFTVWPLQTAGWLATAAIVSFVGRHPVGSMFR